MYKINLIMMFHLLIFTCIKAFISSEPTCCPDTWVAYNGSCYLFSHQHVMTFVETEHYCQQHKAHMVNVGSRLENLFLKNAMAGMKDENRWIGLTDEAVDTVWRWSDTNDVAIFTDWFPGGPGGGAREGCAVFAVSAGYQWDDYPCNHTMEAVCEMRPEAGNEIIG